MLFDDRIGTEEDEQVRDSRRPVVPVFLLPTGTRRSDYFIAYAFDDAMERLRSSVLRQPVLEVWSARPEIDRELLKQALQDRFRQDLNAKKGSARVRQGLADAPTALEARRAKKKQKAASRDFKITAILVSLALLGMLLALNPILLFLVFLFALAKGIGAVGKALEYLGHLLEGKGSELILARSRRQLSDREAKLDKQAIKFTKAIENLQVRVHPHLQGLLVAFSESEGRPHLRHIPSPDPPDVSEVCTSREYRRSLPDWALPVLEQHLGLLGDH